MLWHSDHSNKSTVAGQNESLAEYWFSHLLGLNESQYHLKDFIHLLSSRVHFTSTFLLEGSTKSSVTRKKLPKVYKSCPKIISQEKLKILTPSQKLPKNVIDLGEVIVAKAFKKLPKVQ